MVSRGPRGRGQGRGSRGEKGGKRGREEDREEDHRERSMWGRVVDCGVALRGGVEMRPVVREAQI